MDSPPKLSGETLIVHHIPLVHCQVQGRQCFGGSVKHQAPFSSPPDSLGLTRTTSLPEQDVLHKEALVYSSLIQTSNSSSSSSSGAGLGGGAGGGDCGRGGRGRGSVASDDSSSFTSNASEEPPLVAPLVQKSRDRCNPQRHNPFLLNTGDEEEEEGEEGDDLNGYLEDSSFHLHGNSNANVNFADGGAGNSPFHLHDLGFDHEPFHLHDSLGGAWGATGVRVGATDGQERSRMGALGAQLESLGLPSLEAQCRHGSSGSTMSVDCGEQEWCDEEEDGEETDEDQHMRSTRPSQSCSCCSSMDTAPPTSRQCCCSSQSEAFSEGLQPGYGSDSSCNSSDGVLVNFSAIYNKMNNAIPANPKPLLNLNGSIDRSCTSSSEEPGGAFYLDLHTSPTEPQAVNPAVTCGCRSPQPLDANCNSYHMPCEGLSDMTSCFQSQARLVVATQNYYKLVTCDLSSQSSPSPLGTSVTSCPEEIQASPDQPTEYYLFRQDEEKEEEEESSQRERECEVKREEQKVIEGQVYVNTSPPVSNRGGDKGRLRSRSYDRNLDKSPTPRLGSLERMLSCPVRLSEGATPSPPRAPPRVTSFAEIARSKRRNGCGGVGSWGTAVALGSPSLRSSYEASTTASSAHSLEISPIPELLQLSHSHSLPPLVPFTQCYGQGSSEKPPHPQTHRNGQLRDPPRGAHQEARTKAEGGSSSSSEGRPAVVRYSKDQRPTSLPIQPFTFQHQLSKQQHNKLLRPLLTEYVNNHMQQGRAGQEGAEERPPEEHRHRRGPVTPAPGSIRPSPLGSYSPVRHRGEPNAGTCSTCTASPSPHPPRSLSCPLSAGLLPVRPSPQLQQGHAPEPVRHKQVAPPLTPPPPLLRKDPPTAALPTHCLQHDFAPPAVLSPLGHLDTAHHCGGKEGARTTPGCCSGPRPLNVHHLSPQALKWREYRRKNPLGVERVGGGNSAPLSSSLDSRRGEGRLARRNVFDFPASSSHAHSRQNGQSTKQQQNYYSDIFPDYFSLTERPPDEFCLSPDASSESLSIDLLQKKGLVKAINTAVDLIVAHFGTSRDPGVKAKLGNSSVSPNVGHLILKYLCPAIRDILQDGLRGYVLDLIIGQRRNVPWSVVEASTQLGPSTRVLHGLYSKVSQYSELTSHSMRLNAFIFGLLNLRSLEFWFNHLYMHEDIIAAHYHPWGFLPLSQGACQPLFEELLLLLQPLSLLPFHLDLLFEPGLLQKGQEHLRRKEQLCSAGQGLEQSARSTFQLMRGWSSLGAEPKREGVGQRRAEPRQEGLRPRKEGAEAKREGAEQRRGDGFGVRPEGLGREANGSGTVAREREWKVSEIGADMRREVGGAEGKGLQRAKGVGGESEQGQEVSETEEERGKDGENQPGDGTRPKDRQAGWWYQLMQSSQVYIDNSTEGSKFVKWEKRKKPAGEAAMAVGRGSGVDRGAGRRLSPPPPREGVVEGAESVQEGAGVKEYGGISSSSSDSSSTAKVRRSWMGSPPESVLSELKSSKEEQDPEPQGPPPVPGSQEEGPTSGLRWSRLFGAPVRPEKADQSRLAKSQKSRLPSGWLSLDKSVLDLMAQTVGAGKRPDPLPASSQSQAPTPALHQPEAIVVARQHPPREVRALCDHSASEAGQLSFSKGDVLRVLSRAQPDWLLCALGDSTGLVPIIYVTLAEEPPQGPDPGPH